ncbi:stimulated by retinoic acid gene 6 protein-like isoform X2 [Dreissena polymorpha]|uniref:stimulated by retinoic acid gene 6 protein-like isoform X2 n=1 Tax=Dreissena polymorpha TaxID=45954 RepID=UPI002264F103|nr:stimulated by retinoic acid gene 6 protein-like isoform X2 [Dreissena polymorpha]
MDADNVSATSTIGVSTSWPPEFLQCKERLQHEPTVVDSHWFIIPSVLILLILAFLDKRRDVCMNCCNGRPGLPRPLSFLDERRNTWGILFAFGAVTTHIVLVIQRSFAVNFPIWAKIFMVYILSLETSLICYPLFACMTTRHIRVGAITGLFYSVGWLIYQIYRLKLIIRCTQRLTELISNIYLPLEHVIIPDLPAMICSTLLIAKFSWRLIKCYWKKRFTRTLSEEASRNICNGCDLRYVKALLNQKNGRHSDERNSSVRKKIYHLHKYCRKKICHYFFKPVTGFKFPIAIKITALFSVLVVFINTIKLAVVLCSLKANSPTVEHTRTVAVVIASLLNFISGIRCVYVMLVNYRRDMLCLYRGDRSFIPESLRNMSPQMHVVQGLQYIGFSLVGSFLGSLLAFFVLFVPLFMTLLVLTVLDRTGELHSLWPEFFWLIFPVSLLIIFKVQVELVNKIFLQDRINIHDDHRPLAIRNRVAYDVFAFVMVFFNACIGLIRVLKRIFVSFFYGVFLIARMDRSLLLSGYETKDESGACRP